MWRLSTSSTPFNVLKNLDFVDLFWGLFFRVLLFCIFQSSKFWRNWAYSVKKPLGLQNRGRFEKVIFRILRGAFANSMRIGRTGVSRLLLHLGSLPKMALQLRCGGFSRLFVFVLFFRTRFHKLQVVLFTPASCFLVFPIFCAFFLGLGSTQPSTGIFGNLAVNPPYYSAFFFFLQKHCFPPEKGVILVHFSVSPFFLLGFFHFSLSLSLSLYISFLFFVVFFLPCCLVFLSLLVFVVFLVLFLCFCFMKGTTSKYYIWKASFHNLFLFCFFFLFCFVFKISFSYHCFFFII